MWCIAWWHSGREDEDDDDEVGGTDISSRTVQGGDETLTPLSIETPFTSEQQQDASSRSQTSGELAIRNIPTDSVKKHQLYSRANKICCSLFTI